MGSEAETLAAVEAVVEPIRRATEPDEVKTARQRASELPARPEMSTLAVAVVQDTLVKLLTGKIPVRKPVEAKQVIETCFGIVRLEAGEATSITQMNGGEIMENIKALRQKLQRDLKPKMP